MSWANFSNHTAVHRVHCLRAVMQSNALFIEDVAGKLIKKSPNGKFLSKTDPHEKSTTMDFPAAKLMRYKSAVRGKLLFQKAPKSKLSLEINFVQTKNIPYGSTIFRFSFLLCFLLNLRFAVGEKNVVRRPPRATGQFLSDEGLLELVQKQTFRYFWDYGHPVSGLAREWINIGFGNGEVVTIGGSGFGLMTILVAAERGWVTRQQAAARMDKILKFLKKADRFHGIFPHWMNGTSGKIIDFHDDDHAGDVVESAFMMQGLLTVRQYFNSKSSSTEKRIRSTVNQLWKAMEWTRHMPEGKQVLAWGDPHQPGIKSTNVVGWNEGLITYILAAASPTYPIDAKAYHKGWANDGDLKNGKKFYGIRLPLGSDFGGPLFFAHYSFLGLDPRGLKDKYADYWAQNVNHTLINYEYCVKNPKGFPGYSNLSWGLTASTSPDGYTAHSPTNDIGTIAPTAALSSMPYAPKMSMRALRHFYQTLGPKLWGEYGFRDAFNEGRNWYSEAFLAIDQGPIILMIENYRTGLLWKLFMSCPEVHIGLKKLGFESPHLKSN